jgi:hypothetical protein
LDVAVYKLPVCSRKKCKDYYETSSCGSGNIINEIKKQVFLFVFYVNAPLRRFSNPEVVDLLLCMLSCVATGNNVKGWNRGGLGLKRGGNIIASEISLNLLSRGCQFLQL